LRGGVGDQVDPAVGHGGERLGARLVQVSDEGLVILICGTVRADLPRAEQADEVLRRIGCQCLAAHRCSSHPAPALSQTGTIGGSAAVTGGSHRHPHSQDIPAGAQNRFALSLGVASALDILHNAWQENALISGRQPMVATGAGPFRHVLVGWDGSPDSLAAFRMAVRMVSDGPGTVTAFAVLPSGHQPEAYLDHPTRPEDHIREAFETARAASAGSTSAQLSFRTAVSSHVAEAICDYARDHSCDLVIIGRHGYGSVPHGKLGHVSQSAAKLTKIPVLIISANTAA
jgi:nucleotide-binding universal stress UspA family protein